MVQQQRDKKMQKNEKRELHPICMKLTTRNHHNSVLLNEISDLSTSRHHIYCCHTLHSSTCAPVLSTPLLIAPHHMRPSSLQL